jgi:hypothetical protein
MSAVITAVVATSAISAGVSAYSGAQARSANKKAMARLDGLTYEEDPLYTSSQASLDKLGSGLLKGDVPDYYKSIGEAGGSEFESMVSLMNRDIQKNAAEAMASSGRARGGNLAAVTAQETGDATAKLRYADTQRALAGKQYLLNTGINVENGVRSAAFANMTGENQFNKEKTQALIGLDYQKASDASKEMAGYGSALSAATPSIISGIYGMVNKVPATSLLDKLFNMGSGGMTGTGSSSGMSNGVSSLGSISGGTLQDELARIRLGGG